ncbi:MAG: NAD(P)-dependent alcohol dehydrogenase [Candidatus Thorarchaeota archaeon]|nr:MAG: NAD(P)-dependent alcohol dehydrogenase [Candidatus Thorarchaeota archaeon]
MKAIVWTRYGPPEVLQLREVEKPGPKDDEVLIKIRATTATAGDCEMRRMKTAIQYRILMRLFVGLRRPKRLTILGMELAGIVEAVGKDVTKFKKDDEVFASTGFTRSGTYTEYICLPEEAEEGNADVAIVAMKPTNMSFEEAAPIPMGGVEALCLLRQANLQRGQRILINGAGGTIGSFAVQLAKSMGAEVHAVDSTNKLDMLRSIGADHTIDYKTTDFTASDDKYDVIFDIIGKAPYSGSIRSLKENGIYITGIPKSSRSIRGRWTSRRSSKKVVFGRVYPKAEDLEYLAEFIEAGELISVIDRTFSLEETAEAHRYVESGQKQGHVVISLD